MPHIAAVEYFGTDEQRFGPDRSGNTDIVGVVRSDGPGAHRVSCRDVPEASKTAFDAVIYRILVIVNDGLHIARQTASRRYLLHDLHRLGILPALLRPLRARKVRGRDIFDLGRTTQPVIDADQQAGARRPGSRFRGTESGQSRKVLNIEKRDLVADNEDN